MRVSWKEKHETLSFGGGNVKLKVQDDARQWREGWT